MRSRDPLIALESVLAAGLAIERFLEGLSLCDYEGDALVRSAVERQFEIVGEALGRALRADPRLEDRLPEAPAAIGLRNVIAHGYDEIVYETLFRAARTNLPVLLARVREVLDSEPDS